MKLTVDMKGQDEIQQKLRQLAAKHQEAAKTALYEQGQAILAESIKRTPVDTGRLRASAYCAPPENDGGDITVKLGYGVAYAAAVHERVEARHPVGEAKFLEKALSEAQSGYAERLGKRIEELAEE